MYASAPYFRCPEGRLHTEQIPELHLHQDFADPPTGTPKNGKRAARAPFSDSKQTRPTPVASRQDLSAESPVLTNDTSPRASLSPEPFSVSFSRAVSPFVLIPVTPPPSSQLLPSVLPTRERPGVHIDTAGHQLLNLDPFTPTPAPGRWGLRDPSFNASPTTPSVMSAVGNPPNFQPAASPADTILVPETPLDEQPHNLVHQHRRQLNMRNGSVASSSIATTNDTDNMLEVEIEHLRAQRARLVEQINELTACVNRVRLRQQLAELDARHERALAQKAELDMQIATAKRVAAETRVTILERAKSWWKILFMVGILLIGGYWTWCWENTPDAMYIRQKSCEWYGLSSDC